MEQTGTPTWGHSEQLDELGEALVAAQAELTNPAATGIGKIPSKDGKAGYEYRFAPLDEIIDQTKPILAKNGLALVQMPTGTRGSISLRTMLLHRSGQYLWWLTDLDSGQGAQGQGAAITYARRYARLSALDLFNDTDADDGGRGAQASYEQSRNAEQARRERQERLERNTQASRPAQKPASPSTSLAAATDAGERSDAADDTPDPRRGKLPAEARAMVDGIVEAAKDAGLNDNALILLARKVQKDARSTVNVRTEADLGRPELFTPEHVAALLVAIEAKAAHK